jgi:Domain of unknown function (DUF4338)
LDQYRLPAPTTWGHRDRQAFVALARALGSSPLSGEAVELARRTCLRGNHAPVAAAAHVLTDLVSQGWAVRIDDSDQVSVRPPTAAINPSEEKQRVRRQELLKRDEQLSTPAARRFIAEMERPREFDGAFVSIFHLMRDGRELKSALERVATQAETRPSLLRTVVDPYVQIVGNDERCLHTGLRLGDIWRYFRHTWTNQYTTTPGRNILILVRDRAAAFHPVIGIAALGSAIVQIRERDDWIGWQPERLLTDLAKNPTLRLARWVVQRLEAGRNELYLDDLVADGLYWPSLWDRPSQEAILRLRKEAEARRRDHHRFVQRSTFKRRLDADDQNAWRQRSESDLFRSKRCLALAELLQARAALHPFFYPTPSRAGLRAALDDVNSRRAIGGVLRRAKAESVGTEIADLTVCGAVPPYNALLGGKLISMLAVSPSVVRAYHDKYRSYASEIASSMAARPIRRRTNLVFVGTTSLYGSGSSQYNRVRIPADVLGSRGDIEFRQLGRSRSFGTSHLSGDAVRSLVRLSEQSRTGVRVNSIFGEGVNPKLRKVRAGLDLLGWPSDELLQHGRQRIVYGVSLVANLLPYLLGVDAVPNYLFRRNVKDDVAMISDWWMRRWLSKRIRSADVLAVVATHQLDRPVRHGARVVPPPLPASDHD